MCVKGMENGIHKIDARQGRGAASHSSLLKLKFGDDPNGNAAHPKAA
jgi:hypothetical protein